jgi:hypothetical protein
MGYPETATGFCVNDTKNWSEFKKQDVSSFTFTKPCYFLLRS